MKKLNYQAILKMKFFFSSIVVSVDIIFFPVLTKLFERKFDGYIIK